jgi:hypothetical protein
MSDLPINEIDDKNNSKSEYSEEIFVLKFSDNFNDNHNSIYHSILEGDLHLEYMTRKKEIINLGKLKGRKPSFGAISSE